MPKSCTLPSSVNQLPLYANTNGSVHMNQKCAAADESINTSFSFRHIQEKKSKKQIKRVQRIHYILRWGLTPEQGVVTPKKPNSPLK